MTDFSRAMYNQMSLGQLLERVEKYAGKYSISIQFWGEGNNNVFIEKDGVELYSSGGFENAAEAMTEALEYLDRINPLH